MEQTEPMYTDTYRINPSTYLEVIRTGRSSTVYLWLCTKDSKQYLKSVDRNHVLMEVTALRKTHPGSGQAEPAPVRS